jgi:hypothetical protein
MTLRGGRYETIGRIASDAKLQENGGSVKRTAAAMGSRGSSCTG